MTWPTKNGHVCDLASRSQQPFRLEVVMSPTIAALDQLDCDIAVAYVALGVARRSFERCPSAENESAVADAEACVDRLLDERFAVQQ